MRRKENSSEIGPKVWNIGLYLRLSKEDQAKLAGAVHSDSIENQDKILADFICSLKEKYPDEIFEVVGVFIDDGLTGTNTDKRDQFNVMVDGILKGKINCVLFKDLSRMFRNHTEQSHFLELFCPENRVRVISINNDLDTYINPEAVYSFEVAITGVSNDRYCYTISKNILRTFKMKKERGEHIGAFAPYGYNKDKNNRNKLVIDEETAPIVRDIFNWYATGEYSKRKISLKLNELGILSPRMYKKAKGSNYQNPSCKFKTTFWTPKTVTDILSNQIYIGDMVQGKEAKLSYKIDKTIKKPKEEWVIVENTHEPIIDKELFYKVQSLLELTTKVNTVSERKNELNLYAGIIRCKDCGRIMCRKKNKNYEYAYYMCRTYSNLSKQDCTRGHSIREDRLNNAVLKAIQSQVMFVDNISKIVDEIENSPVNKNENRRLYNQYKKINDELLSSQEIIDGLYMDLKTGLISQEQYLRLKETHEDEAERKQRILENIQQQINDLENGLNKENTYIQLFKKYKNITELHRTLIIDLIETIFIHQNKTVEVVFKFSDQLQNTLNQIENRKNNLEIVGYKSKG